MCHLKRKNVSLTTQNFVQNDENIRLKSDISILLEKLSVGSQTHLLLKTFLESFISGNDLSQSLFDVHAHFQTIASNTVDESDRIVFESVRTKINEMREKELYQDFDSLF